jgi:hypothetical protein
MIRIAITQAAYDAIAATLPLGSVGYETERSDTGKIFVWLERRAIDRLEAERRRGEDFSDVIVRIATALAKAGITPGPSASRLGHI